MTFTKAEELPQDIQEKLPQSAQQIFIAAFKAAQSDGVDEEGAKEIAWSSVRNKYKEGADGKYYFMTEDNDVRNKSTVSGGN